MSTSVKAKDEELAKGVNAALRAIKSHYGITEEEAEAKFLRFAVSRTKALIAYDESPAKKKREAAKPKKERKPKKEKAAKPKKAKKGKAKKAKSEKAEEEIKIEE